MSGAATTLARLLRLIPMATRAEGIGLEDAADELGVPVDRIIADVELLTERSYYLPAGSADDLQITLEGDRLRIFSPRAFTRPLKLTSGELLAIAVALRCAGLAEPEARALIDVVEGTLAARNQDPDEHAPLPVAAPGLSPAAGHDGDADPEAIHDLCSRAVLARRRLRFGYLKPQAEAPEVRVLEPWRLLHADGESYIVGRDPERQGLRLFRLDRMLGAQLLEERFEPEPGWDATDAVVRDGQVMLAADGQEPDRAVVHYSERVARWVAERWAGEPDEEGGYLVEHPVFDPRWLVRHVMRYGGEARVE